MDDAATQWVVEHREWLLPLAKWITLGGSTATLLLGTALCGLTLIRQRRPGAVWTLAASAAVIGSTRWLKAATERSRPPRAWWRADALGAVPHDWSFPSAHAAQAALLAGLVIIVWKPGPVGKAAWVGLAIFVGLSRLVLGVHWLSDVAAGWLVGAAAALVVQRATTR